MNEVCARCKQNRNIDVPADLHAYWGPALCRPCARTIAELCDKRDKWPPVPWSDDEEVLLDG